MTKREKAPFAAYVLVGMLINLASAGAAPVCLRDQDISGTKSPDGKVLIVTMRDGKVWTNKLQTPCPNLRFSGFSWTLHQPALICDDSQALRVLESGEICELGKFTLQTSMPH
jgi:hypothetical protein